MAGLGLEQTISVGIQASKAAPTTQARTLINVYDINGGLTEARKPDPILPAGMQNIYDSTPSAPALDDHKITITSPLDEAQAPLLLAAFFGMPTDGGTNPNYTHTWGSDAAALPYVFFENKKATSDYRQQIGCVGESLMIDLDAEQDGFAKLVTTWVGIDEVYASSTLPGTVTPAPALIRNPQRNANNTYNGVAAQIGGKFTFKRDLKRIRNLNGTGKASDVVRNNVQTLDGSLKVRYASQTLGSDQIARQKRQAIWELLTNANQGLRFTVPNLILHRTPDPTPGPGGIEYDIPFTAEQASGAAMLSLLLLNSTQTFVGP